MAGALAMYREWVCANPRLTSEIESSVKWILYFGAGKVGDSTVLSELIYSVSNLWVLFNDKIILDTHKFNTIGGDPKNKLKTLLTVVEYIEVFVELSVRHVWGDKAKWIVIVIIQTFKCILRLVLLYKYKVNLLSNPPIAPLKRRQLEEHVSISASASISNDGLQSDETAAHHSFVLPSTGRNIRTVNSAASTGSRSWKPPNSPSSSSLSSSLQGMTTDDPNEHQLTHNQRVGEALYVVKPLLHLQSMYSFGERAWPPWAISLLFDMLSLTLIESSEFESGGTMTTGRPQRNDWTKQQLDELRHRKYMLLLYLLRSPFYDKFTKHRLHKLLLALSDNVPLIGMLLRPLADYLPFWQNTHLYLWSF